MEENMNCFLHIGQRGWGLLWETIANTFSTNFQMIQKYLLRYVKRTVFADKGE